MTATRSLRSMTAVSIESDSSAANRSRASAPLRSSGGCAAIQRAASAICASAPPARSSSSSTCAAFITKMPAFQ